MLQEHSAGQRSTSDRQSVPKRGYSIDEYSRAFGPGRTKTYELINAGKLKTYKVGSRRFITADSAEALITEQAA